jgi:DNA invertase Pin-like site-specific DNA recombinase
MLIGYARVSILDQTLALQQDALTAAGCEQLYTDTISGSVTERPGLRACLTWMTAERGGVTPTRGGTDRPDTGAR